MLKILLKWAVLLVTLANSAAFAQFISLHQFPLTYVKSSGLDSSGNLFTVTTDPLLGFKNQYAPTGVSGCVLGYPEYRSQCLSVAGGLSFSFPGYTSNKEFKVYVPAGTTFFSLTGNMPQNTQYAVAVRAGAAPARTAGLSPTEYESFRNSLNTSTSFGRLQSGEELVMVHNYGGNMSLTGEARLAAAPLQTGLWLYFRVITGESIYLLSGVYEINRDQYAAAYASTVFGVDGDPTGGVCANCNTSTAPGTPSTGNPSVALTGISLSKTQLTVGSLNDTTLVIRPEPSTASLPTCTANPSTLMSMDPFSFTPTVSQTWRLESAATSLTAPATVTLTCGGKSSTLTVNPAGFASTVSTAVQTDAVTGAVTLKVTLNRGQAELAAGGVADYWVGGLLPVGGLFFSQDEWFFLSPTGWSQLSLPNPALVSFRRNAPVTAAVEELTIPLGFSKAEAAPFKIQVHFGYKTGTGGFRNMGKIWDSTAAN